MDYFLELINQEAYFASYDGKPVSKDFKKRLATNLVANTLIINEDIQSRVAIVLEHISDMPTYD